MASLRFEPAGAALTCILVGQDRANMVAEVLLVVYRAARRLTGSLELFATEVSIQDSLCTAQLKNGRSGLDHVRERSLPSIF